MSQKEIPDIIIGRLPIYLRALRHMEEEKIIAAAELESKTENKKTSSEEDGGAEKNIITTTSQELGEKVGISAAQIRKDLSQFDKFGKQGTGYDIPNLIGRISEKLNLNKVWNVAVVGAGDMGHALTRYQGFKDRGFQIAMVFDNNPELVGKKIGELTIQPINKMAEEFQRKNVKIAMLTVPAAVAQEVTERLIEAGIKAILNYAPINLKVPENIHVQYIDPSTHLQRMTYYL